MMRQPASPKTMQISSQRLAERRTLENMTRTAMESKARYLTTESSPEDMDGTEELPEDFEQPDQGRRLDETLQEADTLDLPEDMDLDLDADGGSDGGVSLEEAMDDEADDHSDHASELRPPNLPFCGRYVTYSGTHCLSKRRVTNDSLRFIVLLGVILAQCGRLHSPPTARASPQVLGHDNSTSGPHVRGTDGPVSARALWPNYLILFRWHQSHLGLFRQDNSNLGCCIVHAHLQASTRALVLGPVSCMFSRLHPDHFRLQRQDNLNLGCRFRCTNWRASARAFRCSAFGCVLSRRHFHCLRLL